MIEIHWLWMPAIVTLVGFLLTYIFEKDQDWGPFSLLTGLVGIISFFIYLIAGILWLFTHIKITS